MEISVFYEIKKDDKCLKCIAKKCNTTVEKIIKYNNIKNIEDLKEGDIIRVK